VFLEPFRLADRFVTNAEFTALIAFYGPHRWQFMGIRLAE
jgi:hypothetical protein